MLCTSSATGRSRLLSCRVWWCEPSDGFAWEALLDDAERDRGASYRRRDDRARFTTGRAVLRLAAAMHLGVPARSIALTSRCIRCHGPHGRPTVQGCDDLSLSLSHAGERVVVALCDGASVGVDTERVERPAFVCDEQRARLVEGCLTAAEREELASLPPNERGPAVCRYWVRKEALVKATGEGIGAMDRITVSPPAGPPALVAWDGPSGGDRSGVFLADLEIGDGYRAALAVMTRADVVVRVDRLDVGMAPLGATPVR